MREHSTSRSRARSRRRVRGRGSEGGKSSHASRPPRKTPRHQGGGARAGAGAVSSVYPIMFFFRKIYMSNKEKYGEVMTPPWFVNNMLDYLPQHIFKDSERTWLDPGAGSGHFSLSLYQRGIRKILMIDINNEHVKTLRSIFGSERVLHGDFLSLQQKFDTIVGNPPFNSGGLKKSLQIRH